MMKPEHVAELLHVPVQTLNTWRSRGTHSIAFVKIGRAVLYPTVGVAEFLERNTIRPVVIEEAAG